MATVNLAYLCFYRFITLEGKRYFHYRAEIALASEIHRLLVPPLAVKLAGAEIHAESHPSSEVGGDLVDVVSSSEGWLAYIADVSGHGVAPGVVMGMVKSAVRTRVSGSANVQPLLDHLNRVIHPLKKSTMFVTFAYVAGRGDEVELATAGHPPILHYSAHDGAVCELRCANLPLGVRPNQSFTTMRVRWQPGDLLVLVTDGLLEVEDSTGNELDMAGLRRVVERQGALPLIELSLV
ncbi:MAG: PP2C family protein-serine/threonine phosphatase [Vicinamibacteraceae bacterium]